MFASEGRAVKPKKHQIRQYVAFFGFVCTMYCMRDLAPHVIDEQTASELLTTGEAARLLNSSRQHVVDLCDRGELEFVTTGTHRRIRRGDLEVLRTRTQKMTRDQRRSLWLSYAVAGRIVEDPQRARLLAVANLEQMAAASRGRPSRWLAEWSDLLAGPLERLLRDYTSHSPRGRELRQNAPFAGLLTDAERAAVLENWKRSE